MEYIILKAKIVGKIKLTVLQTYYMSNHFYTLFYLIFPILPNFYNIPVYYKSSETLNIFLKMQISDR